MTVADSRHAAVMDADGYWRQFPITVRFDKAEQEVIGRILDLQQVRVREEYLPKLRIQQKDGTILIVVVGQTRLLAELAEKRPAKGDWIKIVYNGEAERAAPGMSPTKEFTVEVHRPGTPDPGPSKTPNGSASREIPP